MDNVRVCPVCKRTFTQHRPGHTFCTFPCRSRDRAKRASERTRTRYAELKRLGVPLPARKMYAMGSQAVYDKIVLSKLNVVKVDKPV